MRKSLENLIISMSIGHLELGYFPWHVTCVKMNTKGCLYEEHVSNDFEPTKSLQAESDTLKKVHESTFSESFYKALNALDEKHKNVFALRHFEGLSMKEIAETLEINEGTVKSRLFYATKTLAKELKEFNPIYNQ